MGFSFIIKATKMNRTLNKQLFRNAIKMELGIQELHKTQLKVNNLRAEMNDFANQNAARQIRMIRQAT
jgi:hypothetical protein